MLSGNAELYAKELIDAREGTQFLFFVSTMYEIFKRIRREMFAKNPTSIGDDEYTLATNEDEMIYIAKYIYQANLLKVPGDILECGCFKGYSSCCLSWVASYFSKRLIIADSFEGLPDVGHSKYKPHEYRGDFETVKANIQCYGAINSVEFIKGWYSDSLVNFARPLSVLWMDVDLPESTRDVLQNTFGCLDDRGVILSHEYQDDLKTSEVYVEIQRFFEEKKQRVAVEKLHNHLGVIYTV
jgi:hypothetical protein